MPPKDTATKGLYYATAEELNAIDQADRSGVASEQEVAAAFQTFREFKNSDSSPSS